MDNPNDTPPNETATWAADLKGPPSTRALAQGPAGTQVLPEPTQDMEDLRQRFSELLWELESLATQREFRIIRRLGKGRQGVVLEAVHRGNLDCVTRHALKIFDPAIFPSQQAYMSDLHRVSRQVGVLQQLYHPNLVQCEAFYTHRDLGVVVMELIDGLDLNAFVDPYDHAALASSYTAAEWQHVNNVIFTDPDHRVQPGVAFYILRKILRGLETMHRIGYIHCDIKPSNIMIDRFGTVKLIDFGRATAITDRDDFFLGSPMYMAPELHERKHLGPLVDLYSAGIVVLELLHGGHLMDARSPEREIHRFKLALPGRILDFLPEPARRNETLVKILLRLLAVNPADRYPSATDADAGHEGAYLIHQQLTRSNLDTDYGRELETYLAHRLPPRVSSQSLL